MILRGVVGPLSPSLINSQNATESICHNAQRSTAQYSCTCLAEGYSLRKDIQKSAFARSRGSHDSDHLPRPDLERDRVNESLGHFLLWDAVQRRHPCALNSGGGGEDFCMRERAQNVRPSVDLRSAVPTAKSWNIRLMPCPIVATNWQ